MKLEQLKNIKRSLIRRVSNRQIQAAKFGINTDPAISIEIEDITSALSAIDEVVSTWPNASRLACANAVSKLEEVGVSVDLRDQEVD